MTLKQLIESLVTLNNQHPQNGGLPVTILGAYGSEGKIFTIRKDSDKYEIDQGDRIEIVSDIMSG